MLDKTGTITKGKPAVTDVVANASRGRWRYQWQHASGAHLPRQRRLQTLLRLAASAERNSEHPLGEAIVEQAKAQGLDLGRVAAVQLADRARRRSDGGGTGRAAGQSGV